MTPEVKAINKIIRHNTTLIRRARLAKKLNRPRSVARLQDQWKEETERFKEAINR